MSAPHCPETPPRIAGSELPRSVSVCRYEHVIDASSVEVTGLPGASFGGVAVWVEESIRGLEVGLTLADIPNVESNASLHDFGVLVRVDHVLAPSGDDLEDHTGVFADGFFDRVEIGDSDFLGPHGSHRVDVLQPNSDTPGFAATSARRVVELVPGAIITGARVVGEVTLRLPVDVVTVDVELDAPAVSVADARISMTTASDGRAIVRIENAGPRYAGHEPLTTRGVDPHMSCMSRVSPSPEGEVREVSCEYEVPVDRMRVAVATEVFERRFPFEITLD